jgi:hypothetical protein
LTNAAKAAGPALLFGLRLWASVSLALFIAFYLELDNPYWAGTSAAIVCQPQLGASLRKGWYRMIGTSIGAVAIVVLTALFPQARAPFLLTLALWAAVCAAVATLLRNFASYSAAFIVRLHGRNHRWRRAWRDGRPGRKFSLPARGLPGERDLHRYCKRGHCSRRDGLRRRAAPACRIIRGAFGRNHGPF